FDLMGETSRFYLVIPSPAGASAVAACCCAQAAMSAPVITSSENNNANFLSFTVSSSSCICGQI
ncbi:MAG: hypothetical protein P8Z40_15555, partial [Chloroflexota bacterium]